MADRLPAGVKLNSPTKILFVIDYYKNPYAGTEGQLLKLLSGLDRSRFEPELAVFRNSVYLESNDFPVPVSILHVSRLLSPLTWTHLFKFFLAKRRNGFRLAHLYFTDASIICPPILALLGWKVIISRRDMGYWYNRINLLLLRLNAKYVDKVIVNSKAVRDLTLCRERYRPDQVEVIYNGYQPPDDLQADREKTGQRSAERTLKLVLVANIRPVKRIDDALHALALLREGHPDSVLYIIGDGKRGDLETLGCQLGLGKHVQFLGPRHDVQALLPAFDIGLLCSESEGFSNTLIEYLQAGIAVVCTDVGGNPEIIEHGVSGLLYPPGDIAALSSNLCMLAENQSTRTELARTGRNKVRQRYSLVNMVSLHHRIYTELATVT